MNFNEKLLQLRKESGLSQEQLAETLDVSRQAVSKWELGEAMPEAEKLVRISDCFGVSLDYLLRENAARQPAAQKKAGRAISPATARYLAWMLLAIGFCLVIALGNDGTFFEYWPLSRMVWGMIVQMLAVGGYATVNYNENFPQEEQCRFWLVAVWLFAITPLILGVKLIRILLFGSSFLALAVVLSCVLAGCIAVTIRLKRRQKNL